MAVKKLKAVDVVIVGMGWTGGIIAKELSGRGLKIVGLERGTHRSTQKDFMIPFIRDELKYQQRGELMQNLGRDTVTFRNRLTEEALPMRKLGSFLPGEGVGGAGVHWNGMTFRNTEVDHQLRSHLQKRYGKKAIPKEMHLQDWPQSYHELEPYYDQFERLCGISGKAGNIKGKIQKGGNPFEAKRSSEYPNPPLKPAQSNLLFEKAAIATGFHPYPMPAANMSQPYTNPDGITLGQCQYCGHCEVFGCESNAKSSPHLTVIPQAMKDPDFELRTHSWVEKIELDSSKKKATGVTYTDVRTGEQYFQPAETVFVCTWTLNNAHLLLLSGIGQPYDPKTGKGQVGRNYCYQVISGARLFFEKEILNPFMGAGALGMVIDDFNSDNFDHSDLGFLGGGFIANVSMGARPISTHPVPPGTPKWGKEWKKAVAKWYNRSTLILIHGSNYSHSTNYLDLDPTYKNAFGAPLLRMTYNFTDNDYNMGKYLIKQTKKLIKVMNPTHVAGPKPVQGDYSIVPYQSTHNTGGVIMGSDPGNSAVNRYCQVWEVPNLFVLGASAFPQNTGYNPTGPLGALSLFVADHVKKKYLKNPGALM